MDVLFQLVCELPHDFDRLESVLTGVQDVFAEWYLRSLAKEIRRMLPAFKTFLLAARRQHILGLGEFIGEELHWIEHKCRTMDVARHDREKHLAKLERLTHVSFIDQVKLFWHLGQQLKVLRDGLSELTKSWLSQRNDEQHLVQPLSCKTGQPFSFKIVWFTSADALQYLADKDPAWYEVRCSLADGVMIDFIPRCLSTTSWTRSRRTKKHTPRYIYFLRGVSNGS